MASAEIAIRICNSSNSSKESVADRLNVKAVILKKMGLYKEALKTYENALSVLKSNNLTQSEHYPTVLSNMGLLYQQIGDIQKGLETAKLALIAYDAVLGKNHWEYGVALNNLAGAYRSLELNQEAIAYYLMSVENCKKTLGVEHPEYGVRLNNLASVFTHIGRHDTALVLHQESLGLFKETIGREHDSYLYTLYNIAKVQKSLNLNAESELTVKEALTGLKKNHGEQYFDYALMLGLLAQLEYLRGDVTDAIKTSRKSVGIVNNCLGQEHPMYGDFLIDLAMMLFETDSIHEAKNNLNDGLKNSINQLESVFKFSGESEKKKFLSRELYKYDLAYSTLLLRYNEIGLDFRSEMINHTILLNGVVLENSKDILGKLATLEDHEVEEKIQLLRNTKSSINKQYSLDPSRRTVSIDSLRQLVSSLEADLVSVYSNKFNESTKLSKDWKEVQNTLLDNQIAIEFSHFQYTRVNERTDSTLYLASLIKSDSGTPEVLALFEEKQLKAFLQGGRPNELYASRGFNAVGGGIGKALADSIYKLVWQPLEEHLEGVEKVYYSPSGLLHQIPFAALGKTGEQLLSEQYQLVQVSSTGLLAEGMKEPVSSSTLLVGGVNYKYDSTGADIREQPVFSYLNTDNMKELRGNRGRDVEWDYLPATQTEVESIGSILSEKGKEHNILSGKDATEEAFKALSGNSPSIIHIATHGFFMENVKKDKNREQKYIPSEDPLLRSGLILAGANHAWVNGTNPYEEEDGILTAMEISNMDLSNTDMVVLSACETGLGDIDGSEGVYGLQRAFKMAGVDIIIMSLWSVPDKETAEFMELFYSKWLNGAKVRDAFTETQRFMQVKYANEPLKWAAFVLME